MVVRPCQDGWTDLIMTKVAIIGPNSILFSNVNIFMLNCEVDWYMLLVRRKIVPFGGGVSVEGQYINVPAYMAWAHFRWKM